MNIKNMWVSKNNYCNEILLEKGGGGKLLHLYYSLIVENWRVFFFPIVLFFKGILVIPYHEYMLNLCDTEEFGKRNENI